MSFSFVNRVTSYVEVVTDSRVSEAKIQTHKLNSTSVSIMECFSLNKGGSTGPGGISGAAAPSSSYYLLKNEMSGLTIEGAVDSPTARNASADSENVVVLRVDNHENGEIASLDPQTP